MQLAKQLLVEGSDDLHAIIHLMRQHTAWSAGQENAPVGVEVRNSKQAILGRGEISTKLRESGLQTLGVVVDADVAFAATWDSLRNALAKDFAAVPRDFPAEGLILGDAERRFGAWIMPDCQSHGMLETFLIRLIPDNQQPLWDHAQQAFTAARKIGCPCIDAHTAKAELHTWLAWQDPPGRPFGSAVTERMLHPDSPHAVAFVAWFLKLYGLPKLADALP